MAKWLVLCLIRVIWGQESCERGEYWNNTINACQDCPRGTFSNSTGSTPLCLSCPANQTTEAVRSISVDNCTCVTGFISRYGRCSPCFIGSFYQQRTKTCELCPIGTYQELEAQMSCRSCPEPRSTNSTGSFSLEACICPSTMFDNSRGGCIECASDQVFDPSIGECRGCPIGSFLSQDQRTCVQCPAQRTTRETHATNASACVCELGTIESVSEQCIACPAGHIIDDFGGECHECPVGTFQTQQGQASCEVCPTGMITPQSTECICPENTFNVNSTCITCPLFAISPAGSTSLSQCTCAPGFELIGSVCRRIQCGRGRVLQWRITRPFDTFDYLELQCHCLPRSPTIPLLLDSSSPICPVAAEAEYVIQLNVSLQEQNARNQTLAEILLQVQCYFAANIEMLVEDNVYVVVSDTFTQMTVWLELKSHQEMLATTVWLENASIIESLNGHSKHDTFISLDTKQDSRCTKTSGNCRANGSCHILSSETTGVCSCPPNMYMNTETSSCEICPSQTYNLFWGYANCTACPLVDEFDSTRHNCTCPWGFEYHANENNCVLMRKTTRVQSTTGPDDEKKSSTGIFVSIIAAVVVVIGIAATVMIRKYRFKPSDSYVQPLLER